MRLEIGFGLGQIGQEKEVISHHDEDGMKTERPFEREPEGKVSNLTSKELASIFLISMQELSMQI